MSFMNMCLTFAQHIFLYNPRVVFFQFHLVYSGLFLMSLEVKIYLSLSIAWTFTQLGLYRDIKWNQFMFQIHMANQSKKHWFLNTFKLLTNIKIISVICGSDLNIRTKGTRRFRSELLTFGRYFCCIIYHFHI
jgi:hypothetical protein